MQRKKRKIHGGKVVTQPEKRKKRKLKQAK
jgi:hypothetical protein